MSSKPHLATTAHIRVAFIGSAGIPNRYGGFESFLEHCAPEIAKHTRAVVVTCDHSLYEDQTANFRGVRRIFIPIRANGAHSIMHDLLAFLRVLPIVDQIIVLGVSGGVWFPLFRALCTLMGKRLLVNIDGVEWRRSKFSPWRRGVLRAFDMLAQVFSHSIIYDNPALAEFVLKGCRKKASCIAYSGDHILRRPEVQQQKGTALTICRIEPENNIQMVIEGALASELERYTIVGNWTNSAYGRELHERYSGEPRLTLLNPVYDPQVLAALREACGTYIHGHSVGGTNPSLVEMLFYDSRLLCFECSFNRYTADTSAEYFGSVGELALLLNTSPASTGDSRAALSARYTQMGIGAAYVALFN